MMDQQEQDSNPGGWRKGRFITLSGQHLDLSKMALAPQLKAVGVLMPQNVEASKQEEQKQTWQLASCYEVTTYCTSARLQLTTLAQGFSIPH
jgi:hypothetical protein